jgi:S-adenosylmethionine:tRNA ribosyltransferase-isomerase
MQTAQFDYFLPPELVAQVPAIERDASRLLVLNRSSGRLEHRKFRDLPTYLQPGDVLVLNNSRVVPTRLHGSNLTTGGGFELLLVRENGLNDWWSLVKPGKRARIGTEIGLLNALGKPVNVRAKVLDTNEDGHRRLRFSGVENIRTSLEDLGQLPLPPYIQRDRPEPQDRQRYQTVFAEPAGSVAAPTAGLHFTPELLAEIRARGIEVHFITLHVGLGTFAPVKAEILTEHRMHEERFELSATAAQAINLAKKEHRRVIAVGTTTVRVLESSASPQSGELIHGAGSTNIFIYPPRNFRVVDALLTNFHLPRSTLLMLVSAFAAPGQTIGRELVMKTYAEAIRERYRFFSYGDALLVL